MKLVLRHNNPLDSVWGHSSVEQTLKKYVYTYGPTGHVNNYARYLRTRLSKGWRELGWEGDGTMYGMCLPGFLDPDNSNWSFPCFWVKQSNNGSTFSAIPFDVSPGYTLIQLSEGHACMIEVTDYYEYYKALKDE